MKLLYGPPLKAMVQYKMEMVPLGIGLPCILQRVYLFVGVRAMLALPNWTRKLLNKKEKKRFTYRTVSFDTGKNYQI